MDEFKKACATGPGGWKCSCCGPSPKERPKWRRRARHRIKEKFREELKKVDLRVGL